MRDLPSGTALSALGRDLIDELLPFMSPERHRELRLVATAMAIAEREAITGDAPARDILCALRRFYDESAEGADVAAAPHPNPLPVIPGSSPGREREGPAKREGEGLPAAEARLLHRLAADLRAGAFETCEARAQAARAILWQLTIMKLREGNPLFLAANGFGE